MGKPTFPDQQQDLQNAAEFSLASDCDGSVKFPRRAVEARSTAILAARRGSGRLGVSEAREAFVTTVARVYPPSSTDVHFLK